MTADLILISPLTLAPAWRRPSAQSILPCMVASMSGAFWQMAQSIQSLLDLSTMTIEEAIGRLKVVDTDEPQSSSGPITTGGKLLLSREQWDAGLGDRKKGEPPSTAGGRKRGKPRKARRGGAQGRAQGRAEGDARGGARDGAAGKPKPAQDNSCHNCGRLGHWANECR